MNKVLITTVPFGKVNKKPIRILEENNISYLINPLNKKLTEDELVEMVSDFEIIIAGTETISDKVMSKATNLKLISRVGIGLDSVDLHSAKKRGVSVSYTPDAPAPAVSELTIGLALTLLRSVHVSNMDMHKGKWERFFGRRLSKITVGIIGVGRIGLGVLKHLRGFDCQEVLINDIDNQKNIPDGIQVRWTSKSEIYKKADIVTLHLPLTKKTKNLIKRSELLKMKKDAMIINTSRGGIINEHDLYNVMSNGHLSGAAIDVFDDEPYFGDLNKIKRCILTSHMGSMSEDCRSEMEIKATEEAVRFIKGLPLEGSVPNEEYEAQELD